MIIASGTRYIVIIQLHNSPLGGLTGGDIPVLLLRSTCIHSSITVGAVCKENAFVCFGTKSGTAGPPGTVVVV